jgi:hypothetical protein
MTREHDDDEYEGPLLLGMIGEYDREQRSLIRTLRERVKELEIENRRLGGDALATAQASTRSLLNSILSGAISKPLSREEQIKRLRAIFDAGMVCEGRCEHPPTDDELLEMWEQGT